MCVYAFTVDDVKMKNTLPPFVALKRSKRNCLLDLLGAEDHSTTVILSQAQEVHRSSLGLGITEIKNELPRGKN